MKKALIVANGEVEQHYIDRIYDQYDYIVACDGGYRYLINKKVDVLIGDLDSVDIDSIKPDQKIIKHPPEKDFTDLELSIEHVIKLGYQVDITAFYGARIDHSLTNIFLLKKYKDKIRFINDSSIVEYRDKSFVLKRRESYFSIVPITTIYNLNIVGAKYDLNGMDVGVGESLLNSNQFLDTDVLIEFDRGEMIIIYSVEK